MINETDLIRHTLTEIVRVWREGGTARTVLPHPETGELMTAEIDQRRAEELVTWLTDQLVADLRERQQRGEPLSEIDKAALTRYDAKVPHAFDWVAPRGGPSFLVARNAAGELTGYEMLLAVHPSEFDAPWDVPKVRRTPGLKGRLRLDLGCYGIPIFIGQLRFPADTDLLVEWTRFENCNFDFAANRLSPTDRTRYLLPYGVKVCADGREILFNRDGQPIYAPAPKGSAHVASSEESGRSIGQRWFYDDGHSEAEKSRRAKAALELFLANEPLPPDWRAPSQTRH